MTLTLQMSLTLALARISDSILIPYPDSHLKATPSDGDVFTAGQRRQLQADAAGQPQSDVLTGPGAGSLAAQPGGGAAAAARRPQHPAHSPGSEPDDWQRSDIVPLFSGGVFDDSYNAGRVPKRVALPTDVRRVLLVSVITGAKTMMWLLNAVMHSSRLSLPWVTCLSCTVAASCAVSSIEPSHW
jgi:hypothetical protein